MYYVTTICTTQHGYGIHPPLASYIHTVNCPKILFSLYYFEPQVCPHTNSNSLSTVDGAHVRPGCHCHVHVLEWGSVGMRLDNLEVPEKWNHYKNCPKQRKKSHWLLLLTPSAMAWAMPNLGTFLAQSGLKWSVRQIFPPLCSICKTERWRTVSAYIYRKQLWIYTVVKWPASN